jgi:ABC-2 type transport system permease protein
MNRIIDTFDKGSGKDKVAVLDASGKLYEPLKNQLKAVNKEIVLKDYKGTLSKAEGQVRKGDFTGLLVLNIDEKGMPEATYKANTIADSAIYSDLQTSLQQVKTMIASSQINLTPAQLQKLYEPVSFKKLALKKNAKTEEQLGQARGLVYVLLFVMYFAVVMYANMIAMEVAIEKSSRVMEILISSVSPIRQMFAKILGIGLLSLTQLAVLLSVGYFSLKANVETMKGNFFKGFGFENISVSIIVYAVVFFILGYFLYATLAAFLGSLVSRIEDVQQMITPMTMLVAAGFMISIFGLSKPDSPVITVTSYIPFFTLMIMFLRVGMLNIPFWETFIGILLLVIIIIILAVFGARVYKGGVLMYGKSNSFKDIKQALQLTKNK